MHWTPAAGDVPVVVAGRIAIVAAGAAATLLLAGGAATFAPQRLEVPGGLREVQSKTVDAVTVSVSMLTDEQARRHFGADLEKRNLQALWIRVGNGSDHGLWFIRTILDRDFYSADEAAHLLERDVGRNAREALRLFLRDESMRVFIQPGTISEGFIYLPRVEGGRYVDIRLQADAYAESLAGQPGTRAVGDPPRSRELRFEFGLTLPDGDFDYERLDPGRTYAGRVLQELTAEELRSMLERLPCCASDADGRAEGDPLNVVLVGDRDQLLGALGRSGWSFTHRITARSVRREIGAALAGDPYAVAPVSSLYLFDRRQDVALQRARRSIAQRNHMRLWLAPYTHEGRSVWIGQVSRDIGIKVTARSPTLSTHIIDPEVDTTREYLLHSLIGEGFVDRFGFVKGSAAASPAQPRANLTGDPYFSDGMRLVVLLAPEPVAPDAIRSLLWERSAPPVAEGQSEAAKRNVRPIERTD
jgi:hypothetical protein